MYIGCARILKGTSIGFGVILLFALAGCDNRENYITQHYNRGFSYFTEGKLEKARVEFKNVLQADHKHLKALYLLGKTMEQLQDYRDAAINYRRVLDADPGHLKARESLGYIYLMAKAYDKASELAEEGLAAKPDNPSLLALRGSVRAEMGDVEGALADGKAGYKKDPKNIQVIALLSTLYTKQGSSERGLALLEEGIKSHQKNISMRIVLASAYAERGEKEKAEYLLKEIVILQPDNLQYRIQLALFYAKTGNVREAQQTLSQAVDDFPENTQAKLTYVDFLFKSINRDKAFSVLQSYIDGKHSAPQLTKGLASLYELNNQLDMAKQTYRKIISDGESKEISLQSRLELARIALGEGLKNEAKKMIAEIIKDNPKDEKALFLRAQLSIDDGDADGAITDLRSVADGSPDSPYVLYTLAKAHLLNGETNLAKVQLQKAVKLRPDDSGMLLELARLDAQTADYQAAQVNLDILLKLNPKDLPVLEMLVRIKMAQGDWHSAHGSARSLQSLYPDNGLGYYLDAQIYQGEKKWLDSISAYETAIKKTTDPVLPMTELVTLYLQQNQPAQALRMVNEHLHGNGRTAIIRDYLKGQIHLFNKEYNKAAALFSSVTKRDSRHIDAFRNLALARLGEGDRKGAIDAYKRGIDASGGDLTLQLQLAAIYMKDSQTDEAEKLYEKILMNHPQSLVAVNNLAMLLVNEHGDKHNIERASTLAMRLTSSENPNFLDTIGWVTYKTGNISAAIPYLERAALHNPQSPVVQYHLGKAYQGIGKPDAARVHLGKALKNKNSFPDYENARRAMHLLSKS